MAGKIVLSLTLSESEKRILESYANSGSLAHSLVVRSKIILFANDGQKNKEIAQTLGIIDDTVTKWCKRYIKFGIEGLYDELWVRAVKNNLR